MAVADWVGFLAACFLYKHSLMLSHLLFYHPSIATAAFGALVAFSESWFSKSQVLENWSRRKKEKEEYMWAVAGMIPWHSLRLIINMHETGGVFSSCVLPLLPQAVWKESLWQSGELQILNKRWLLWGFREAQISLFLCENALMTILVRVLLAPC